MIEQFDAAMARYIDSGVNTSRPTYLGELRVGLATGGVDRAARAAAAVRGGL